MFEFNCAFIVLSLEILSYSKYILLFLYLFAYYSSLLYIYLNHQIYKKKWRNWYYLLYTQWQLKLYGIGFFSTLDNHHHYHHHPHIHKYHQPNYPHRPTPNMYIIHFILLLFRSILQSFISVLWNNQPFFYYYYQFLNQPITNGVIFELMTWFFWNSHPPSLFLWHEQTNILLITHFLTTVLLF